MVLAGCSGGGSGASRPTLSASVALPTVTRTADASGAASEGATASAPAASPTAGAPGIGAGTESVGRPSPPAVTTTTSAPAVTTRTSEPAVTATTSEPVTTTTTTTATATRTETRTETQTVAPTTSAATTPAAPTPTTAAAVPSPTPTASPAATETDAASTSSGEIPWWAWALLALVVAGVIAGIVIMQRRRGQAVEAWDRDQADAEDAALWLHDRVLPTVLADPLPTQPVLPGTPTAWSAARPRFVELDEKLSVLARSAPDEDRRAAVGTLRSALADTGLALDQRGTSPSPQAWTAAQTRAELAADHLGRVLSYDASCASPSSVGVAGFGDGSGYAAPVATLTRSRTAPLPPADDAPGVVPPVVPPAQRPAPPTEGPAGPAQTAAVDGAPDPADGAPDLVGRAPDPADGAAAPADGGSGPVAEAPDTGGPPARGGAGGGRHAQPRDEPDE